MPMMTSKNTTNGLLLLIVEPASYGQLRSAAFFPEPLLWIDIMIAAFFIEIVFRLELIVAAAFLFSFSLQCTLKPYV